MVTYNDVDYFYVYNLQGDVVALIDAGGTQVVEYGYDAWGNPISKTGSLAATIGTLNPFRYRGYVYDEETGLYYLRSRYYNPVWKRFVNADHIGERNLFLYCRNSPVFRVDNNGNKSNTCNYPLFQGEFGDKMERVIFQNYKDGRMPVDHFITLLQQMVSEKWQYSHDTAYGAVDCVGIYRYTMKIGTMERVRINL